MKCVDTRAAWASDLRLVSDNADFVVDALCAEVRRGVEGCEWGVVFVEGLEGCDPGASEKAWGGGSRATPCGVVCKASATRPTHTQSYTLSARPASHGSLGRRGAPLVGLLRRGASLGPRSHLRPLDNRMGAVRQGGDTHSPCLPTPSQTSTCQTRQTRKLPNAHPIH